jgi:hypothetical protein
MGWQMEELPGRDSKILAVTSRVVDDPQNPAEADTLGFSVCSTIETGAAGEEDVRNHRVSCLKPCHIEAYFRYNSCGFVTHDERERWGISPAIPDVEIGPANAAGSGMDEDVVRTDFRGGNLFDSKRLTNLMEHRCFHSVSSFHPLKRYDMLL